MISRRRFLEVGSVAVGGAVGGTMGAAMAPRPILATARAANLDDASLPPSLAALKSRKNEATPITRQERHERQERGRRLMSENDLDAIVLMAGTSLQYFTGIRWWGGERMFALVLPAKGAAFYVCPAFEGDGPASRSPTRPTASRPEARPMYACGRKTKTRISAWHRDSANAASLVASWESRRRYILSSPMELPRPHRKCRSRVPHR